MNMKFVKNKKICFLSFLIMPALMSQQALATSEEFSGKSTCYILNNNKLVKKAPCSYTGSAMGSIRYSGTSFDLNVKGFGKISTETSLAAKTDKNGEMIEGNNGVIYNDPVITINNKPAHMQNRYIKDLSIINPKLTYNGTEKFTKTGLSCMQSNDKKLEVCIPLKDNNLGRE